MNTPSAFRATYSDLKLIKTRQCVQIVFELPLADFDAAYLVLGGMPNPANERWFGIAPLKSPQAEKETSDHSRDIPARPQPVPDKSPVAAKRDWRALPKPQQAGIRIGEPTFAAYLREEYPYDWREAGDPDGCIKFMCGISSKRELATNRHAGAIWFQIDSGYQAWLAKERVGA